MRIGVPETRAGGRTRRVHVSNPAMTSSIATIATMPATRHVDEGAGVKAAEAWPPSPRLMLASVRQIPQRDFELSGGLVSGFRCARERTIDDADERRGQVGTHVAQAPHPAARCASRSCSIVADGSRELTGDEIEQEHADAVDDPRLSRRLAVEDFGGEIQRRADQAGGAAGRRAFLAGAEVHQHDPAARLRGARSGP